MGFSPNMANAIAVAQHMDKKRSWPWYRKLFHFLFVSWRCPCCKAERKG